MMRLFFQLHFLLSPFGRCFEEALLASLEKLGCRQAKDLAADRPRI